MKTGILKKITDSFKREKTVANAPAAKRVRKIGPFDSILDLESYQEIADRDYYLDIKEVEALLGPPLPAPKKSELNPEYGRSSVYLEHEDQVLITDHSRLSGDEEDFLVEFYDYDGERKGFAPTNLWYPHSLFRTTAVVVGNTGRFRLKGSDKAIQTQAPIHVWKKI